MSFEGVFPILVTPFKEQEEIDLESFEYMVCFMASLGVQGITILGVLGEANRLVDRERELLIKSAVNTAKGRFPVIVGVTHTGTRATCDLSQMAESLGADAVMVTPSREPIPNEENIFSFFLQVARATSLPIVIQDHPASTQVNMSISLLTRLVFEIPKVACIKEEAPPTPERISTLLSAISNHPVPILTGLGALYGLFELERGTKGFMTGFAFPEVLLFMVRAAQENRFDEVRQIYRRFLPLIVFEQQPGVAIRKEIFRLRGLIATSKVRHPGTGIDPNTTAQIRTLLKDLLPGIDLSKPLKINI